MMLCPESFLQKSRFVGPPSSRASIPCLRTKIVARAREEEYDLVTNIVGKIFGRVRCTCMCSSNIDCWSVYQCSLRDAAISHSMWVLNTVIFYVPTQAAVEDPNPGGLKRMDWRCADLVQLSLQSHFCPAC